MSDRVTQLHQAIEGAEQEIASLLLRANSAGSFGDRRFTNLNAMVLRSKAARVAERKEDAIRELESLGVEFVRKVQLPAAPIPQRSFSFRVIEGGPTGLITVGGGDIGCLHQVASATYEAAESRAVEEHRNRCR